MIAGDSPDCPEGHPVLFYEAPLHPASVGGAPHHFSGLARAIFRSRPAGLQLVLPGFPGAEWGNLPSVPIHRVGAWRHNALGFALYELRKVLLYARLRLRHRGPERPLLLARLGVVGIALPVARLLGYRIGLEVNGVVRQELLDRGLPWLLRVVADALVRLQVRSAHKIFVVTPGIGAELTRAYGVTSQVVPNGVDLDLIPVAAPARSDESVRMLFIGALAPWQDLGLLLRALTELRQENQRWHLDVVGDGECRGALHESARLLGVTDLVTWHGWQPHNAIPRYLAAASICLAPLRPKGTSTSCGSPLKVFEYLAANRPVAGSDVDGIRELALPGLYVYEEGNLNSLLTALRNASQHVPLPPHEIVALRRQISWDSRAEQVLNGIEQIAHHQLAAP